MSVRIRLITAAIWVYWGWFVFCDIYSLYMFVDKNERKGSVQNEEWHLYLVVALAIIAIIEIFITIFLKQYFLKRAHRLNKFHLGNIKGYLRFIAICTINWILSFSIVIYGIVITSVTGAKTYLFIGAIIGLFLMLYHCPRQTSYCAHSSTQSSYSNS